jgi:glycosyltransferase involved in cell wall biosynthesis
LTGAQEAFKWRVVPEPGASTASSATSCAPSARGLVIVPALNEAWSIADVVRGLRCHAPGFDVLVIDDGSSDATARRVPPPATVVSVPFNLGIGGAVQTGYRYAAMHGYPVAVQVDADGQHPPHEVGRLVEALADRHADLVVGSRFLTHAGYRQGPGRRAAIWWLRTLIRLLCGLVVTDATSGFRAANRRVIEAFAHWYPDDYPEPEVVVLLHRAGLRVAEIGVQMQPRTTGRTSIPPLRGPFYVLKVTVALVLAMFRRPWPPARLDPP